MKHGIQIAVVGYCRSGILTKVERGAQVYVSSQDGRLTIGSAPRRGPSFTVEDFSVSRNHAEVVFKDGQWWIRDLNSDNGLHLVSDGRRVAAWVIEDGGLLSVGEVVLQFTLK